MQSPVAKRRGVLSQVRLQMRPGHKTNAAVLGFGVVDCKPKGGGGGILGDRPVSQVLVPAKDAIGLPGGFGEELCRGWGSRDRTRKGLGMDQTHP